MHIQWMGLSAKFRSVHHKEIEVWLRRFLNRESEPCFNLVPRTPLGPITEDVMAPDQMVTIIQLQAELVSTSTDRILIVRPDKASEAALADWEKKHHETDHDEFDWLPSFERYA